MSSAPIINAPATSSHPQKIHIEHELSQVFKSEQYQINQPYVQIRSEGYDIVATDGSEKYRAERPRLWIQSAFASLVGMGATFAVIIITIALVAVVSKAMGDSAASTLIAALVGVSGFVAAILAFIFVSKLIAPIRRATVSDSAGKALMIIEPTSAFFLIRNEFKISDAQGKLLATFEKSYFHSIFRIKWHCKDAAGKYLFSAMEDSWFLSLLRRYVNLAQFIPMHFMFSKMGGKPFGQFERRYSLRDKYKLNYSSKAADGWLIVATAILLDTGEKR